MRNVARWHFVVPVDAFWTTLTPLCITTKMTRPRHQHLQLQPTCHHDTQDCNVVEDGDVGEIRLRKTSTVCFRSKRFSCVFCAGEKTVIILSWHCSMQMLRNLLLCSLQKKGFKILTLTYTQSYSVQQNVTKNCPSINSHQVKEALFSC